MLTTIAMTRTLESTPPSVVHKRDQTKRTSNNKKSIPLPFHPTSTMPKSKVAKYHDLTRPMMSFVHNGTHFDEGHVFSQAELLAVTPERLMEYLLLKIYHNSEANPDVDPEVLERAVANMLDTGIFAWKSPASDSRKQGAEAMTHATPNPYRALTLDEPNEASTSSAMLITTPTKPTKVPHHAQVPPQQPSPAKGSAEELALINDKKKD